MRFPRLVPCAISACILTSSGIAQTRSAAHLRPQVMGAASPSASTHFSVFLPLTNRAALEQLLSDQVNPSSPSYRKWLTPSQFKAQFGPNPASLASLKSRLEAAGFTVTAEHTQNIEVEGSVAAVENLFSTRLQQVRMAKGNMKFSAANHQMKLPADLAAMGAIIPEFHPHLAAHVHSERLSVSGHAAPLVAGGGATNERLSSADSFFYPNDMKQAYVFPSFTTTAVPKSKAPSGSPVQIVGLNTHIGIVISSTVLQSDINRSFNSTVSAGADKSIQNYSGNTSLPVPAVTIHPVLGGSGAFNPNTDDASEASLDTQMSLGTAPGAQEIVYDMPDLSDASIVAAYSQVNEENIVDVVSSSFGECELDFIAASNGGTDFTGILQVYHSLFAQGNAQGITFVASSGDNGAVPCTSSAFDNNPTNGTNFVLGVENPASDPAVTAVGGTNLSTIATPTVNDATYAAENANYDPRVPAEFTLPNGQTVTVGNNTWGSGGGYSIIFGQPAYQKLVKTGSTTARAVPDVSLMMGGCPGDADLNVQDCTTLPRSAAIIWIGGVPNLLIGTSSSAPQMAGVIALNVELAGTRLGNINQQLYSLSALQTSAGAKTANLSQIYHRNISGNNNGYTVAPGQAYSPVLGNGTIFVKNFLQLQSAAPAGTPSTPTNP
jgi:subtilase family serine protease